MTLNFSPDFKKELTSKIHLEQMNECVLLDFYVISMFWVSLPGVLYSIYRDFKTYPCTAYAKEFFKNQFTCK